MYIKWIVCEIKENMEREFSIAQEQWIETQNSDGFIGQVGGFDLNNSKMACIISFWEDKRSLERFMIHIHDKVFFKNNQSECYKSIRAKHFNSILKMEGKFDSLIDTLNNGKLLRIADCIVKREKRSHFETVQKEIWLKGMKDCKGMLEGTFSKDIKNASHYLVATFWSSSETHKKYVVTRLPKLKIKADAKNDLVSIVGRQIILVDLWRVIKNSA